MTSRRKQAELRLPDPVPEDGYPDGDGAAWISEALGVPDCLVGVARHFTDDGETTTLVLRFANECEQVFRPARLVTTRRLAEVLGALGFPVPYYSAPQLAQLGQAIGRVADRARDQTQEDSWSEFVSVVAAWLTRCLRECMSYVLDGRGGVNVRAAIEFVRTAARDQPDDPRPIIIEPNRERGTLLVWTPPVRALIRRHFGTVADGTIGLQLSRAGVERERLAARPASGARRTVEIPVFVLYNGWHGVTAEMPDGDWESGPFSARPLETVVEDSRACVQAHTRTKDSERSTTPNGADGGIDYDALRSGR